MYLNAFAVEHNKALVEYMDLLVEHRDHIVDHMGSNCLGPVEDSDSIRVESCHRVIGISDEIG